MKKKLLALALVAIFAFAMCACGGTATTEIPDISGEYQDEVSQRATMTLTKHENGNTYDAVIGWSDSATELVEWAFTGDFDGEKLEYTDGICKVYTSAEDGSFTEEIRDGDYSGTLTLGDEAKLTWAGATEDETAVFVLTSNEDGE